MGYKKNQKSKATIIPVALDEQKSRRYKAEIAKSLEIIESHRKKLSILEFEISSSDQVLKETYEKHKVEVANLYNELGKEKKDFQIKCCQWEESFAVQQKRIDEQKIELETERISIADDKKDLIEKENKLIKLSNDIIGDQQAVDNKEEYLQSVDFAIQDQKRTLKQLQDDLQVAINKNAALIKHKENLEKDLEIRVKQHDARIDEVNAQIRELKKYTEEYKEVQAAAIIANEDKEQFEQEVLTYKIHSKKLKTWEEKLQDKENELNIREKSLRLRSNALKDRTSHVKVLEKKQLGGSNGGRSNLGNLT